MLSLDVIKAFSKYACKLDSKSRSKYQNISTLGEEPASIFKALEENIAKNNNNFIDTLRKEFAECNRNNLPCLITS